MSITSPLNWIIGYLYAMQFNADGAMSSCTYTAFELVNALSAWEKDLVKMKEEAQWYNFLIYDTNHVLGNAVSAYEYCATYQSLEYFAAFFPEYFSDWTTFDLGLLSQNLTRTVLLLKKEIPKKMEEYNATKESGEWFYTGYVAGEIANLIFIAPQP